VSSFGGLKIKNAKAILCPIATINNGCGVNTKPQIKKNTTDPDLLLQLQNGSKAEREEWLSIYKNISLGHLNDIKSSYIDNEIPTSMSPLDPNNADYNNVLVYYYVDAIYKNIETYFMGPTSKIWDDTVKEMVKSDAYYVISDVSKNTTRNRRIYEYTELNKLVPKNRSSVSGISYIDLSKVDSKIKEQIISIETSVWDGGSAWNPSNWGQAQGTLTQEEVNAGGAISDPEGVIDYGFTLKLNIPAIKIDTTTGTNIQNNDNPNAAGINKQSTPCNADALLDVITSSNCSVTAYIVNSIISGIAQMFGIVLGWISALFNWIFDMSVLNFKDWVQNSHAVEIYKTIILAAIASLMLPLVFYLIIMMLIENDTKKIEKVLPKILFTALFIYFSFGIAGWLVDQSNIVTIYTYRAIHGGNTSQNLGDVIQCTLGIGTGCEFNKNIGSSAGIQNAAKASMGDWGTVAYTFGQLVINLVGLYVVFQAMMLIFLRSIILLLCLIFSPIMVLPDDLPGKFGDVLKKYKGMVMTNFINNLLLAPIFMFMMMIAIRIGNISGDLIKTNSELDAATVDNPGFLAGIIKTIVVVVVMQLAITVAKNLSGEVGGTISGAVSSFTGGVASGATKAFNRIRGNRQINTTSNAGNGNAAENPWQNNNTQNRRPIPLQTAQSSVIAPTGQQSVQNQALGNNFAAASSKINTANQSIINSLPDTKRRSLAGYQTISNQRNKSAANRNSVQQKATQNNRSVAAQTQVNNDRVQRKLSENKTKVQNDNLKKYAGASSNIKTGQITKRGADGKFQTMSTELKTESRDQMTNKVSSQNKLREQAKKNQNRGGGDSSAPELSNSTVTGHPPTLNLSGKGGAQQQIPLSNSQNNNSSQRIDRSKIDSTRKILDNKTASGSALPSMAKFNDQGTTALREKLRANNGELAKKFINMSQKDQEALKLSTTIQAAAKRIREMKKNGAK
jgi:hypothetical protein